MNQVFSSLFNLSSSFFAIYLFSLLLFSLIWIVIVKSAQKHSSFKSVLLILISIVENLLFIFAAKEQPSFYFGFWVTEFLSILFFYLSILLIFIQLIKAIKSGFSTLSFVSNVSHCLLYISVFQLSYVIAFGSPLTLILWVISLIFQIIKFTFAKRSSLINNEKVKID